MRIIGFAPLFPLLAAVAGCGQHDSGNVMATSGNALTQAQIERALGPEPGNEPLTGVDAATDDSAAEPEAIPANSAEEEQP